MQFVGLLIHEGKPTVAFMLIKFGHTGGDANVFSRAGRQQSAVCKGLLCEGELIVKY